MRKIIKNQPPASLVTFMPIKNPEDPNYKATYDGLDENHLKDIRKYLLNEQGWVCGYCQQKITDKTMKIEHHCEQTICNGTNGTVDRTLDYTNMMAVCEGKIGNEIHCDSKKSQFNIKTGLPMSVSPWLAPHMKTIEYTSTGNIKSTNKIYDKEIDTILNLNTKYLKDLRSKKFNFIYKASRHEKKSIQIAKMKSILEKDLQIANFKFSNNFPGLSEYMLNKYCK